MSDLNSLRTKYSIMARQVARDNGIDENIFVSLVNTESSFNPDAKDFRTGTHYGLTQVGSAAVADVGGDMSRVFDPYYNLTYGAKYLAQMKAKFGNYYDALRGYNQGPTTAVYNRRAGSEYANKILSNVTTPDVNITPENADQYYLNNPVEKTTADIVSSGVIGGGLSGLNSWLEEKIGTGVIYVGAILLVVLLLIFGLYALVTGESNPAKAAKAVATFAATKGKL